MGRTLLLDGDVLVYQAAAAVEKETEWDDDLWTLHADLNDAKHQLTAGVAAFQERLEGDVVILALSDPNANFRKGVYPLYKSNRKKTRKPIVYRPLRQFVVETYTTYERPGLEGDDILGILSTHPKLIPGEKVVVSIDKDLKTIPGLFYRNEDDGLVEVTEEQADRWHMIQTLAGDATDGYPGCPGMGIDRARKAVEEMTKLVPFTHTLTRGPRAGQSETRYEEQPAANLWEVVVSRYVAAGLSEEVALQQARCARILRHTDYDFKKKEPILWDPRS